MDIGRRTVDRNSHSTSTTDDDVDTYAGTMTRGNQRETDRLKAQKKATQAKNKPKESASTLQQRREKDAEILRQKQKKKEEDKAAGAAGDGAKK